MAVFRGEGIPWFPPLNKTLKGIQLLVLCALEKLEATPTCRCSSHLIRSRWWEEGY